MLKFHLIIVSTFDCSNFVVCGCSLIYSTISQAMHVSSKRLFLFDSTDDSGFCSMIRAIGTVSQNHPLPALSSIDAALRNSHTSHLHRLFLLYNKCNTKKYLDKKTAKIKLECFWEDTRFSFCQQMRFSSVEQLENITTTYI